MDQARQRTKIRIYVISNEGARVRILFCNYEYPPLGGGGGVVTAWLAEELAKRHSVTVLTSQGVGLPRDCIERGVRVVRAPIVFRRGRSNANFPSMLAFMVSGIFVGRRLLATENYDVVNTHFALPTGPVGQALADDFSLPNVLTVHGGDLYDPSKRTSPHRHALLRRWVRSLARRATAVVGQSSNTIENLHRYYAPDCANTIIPLGIPRPADEEPADRHDFGIVPVQPVLVTVGRLVRRKRVDQLIRMLATDSLADVVLLVIGDGPEARSLHALSAQLGVGDRVRFLGFVSERNKAKLLRMSDVFVSPSQHEGFGLMFLEAMASSLPVVCYDHGGQSDFLRDRVTGYVVSRDDPSTFQDRCHALCEDEALRRRMGQDNLRCVEEYFIESCAERYETIFRQAISSTLSQEAMTGQ